MFDFSLGSEILFFIGPGWISSSPDIVVWRFNEPTSWVVVDLFSNMTPKDEHIPWTLWLRDELSFQNGAFSGDILIFAEVNATFFQVPVTEEFVEIDSIFMSCFKNHTNLANG